MKEYLIALFCVCCAAAVVKAISPEGATKKHIELICSVCIISAMALPLSNVISGITDIKSLFGDNEALVDNYDEIYKSHLLNEGIKSAEDAISRDVCKSVDVPDGAIKIRLYLNENGEEVSSATAIVGKDAVTADPKLIKDYVKSTLGAECEIVYDFNDEK
jgi:hypothetical protein